MVKNEYIFMSKFRMLYVETSILFSGEFERIRKCNGRVFAREKESSVYRVWMPDQDSPGLAMARAFGDFCLKDFGLISVPEIYYRKLTSKDEFLVLATDGVSVAGSADSSIGLTYTFEQHSHNCILVVYLDKYFMF